MIDKLAWRENRAAIGGLLIGPLLAFVVFLLLPDSYITIEGEQTELPQAARVTAAVAILMAVWWMTEAISVYATALLPLALFPLFNVSGIHATAIAYGNEIIYLFLGGFILALALERWGLHKRLALNVLALVGSRPRAIVGAFMGVSAGLSMWVTNTATTIMLLPVAVSVIKLLPDDDLNDGKADNPFSVCLLLGIAYASSIGGMGTIIGTAPNVFVVSFIQENLQREIGFVEWMTFALPIVLVFVPLAWLVLTRWVFRIETSELAGFRELVHKERRELLAMTRGETLTLVIFALTASAWVFRPVLNELTISDMQPLAGLSDPGIAIIGALALFITPVNLSRREFLMDWGTALKLPWGLLILFGGGLALAAAMVDSGVSGYLGHQVNALAGLPPLVILATTIAAVVFLTELTSNTATTATIVPILLAVSIGLGLPPLLLVIPAAFAASSAFMLPVATPPNAIVFGSNLLRVGQMSRAGIWLNILAIGLITGAGYIIIAPLLGISL